MNYRARQTRTPSQSGELILAICAVMRDMFITAFILIMLWWFVALVAMAFGHVELMELWMRTVFAAAFTERGQL